VPTSSQFSQDSRLHIVTCARQSAGYGTVLLASTVILGRPVITFSLWSLAADDSSSVQFSVLCRTQLLLRLCVHSFFYRVRTLSMLGQYVCLSLCALRCRNDCYIGLCRTYSVSPNCFHTSLKLSHVKPLGKVKVWIRLEVKQFGIRLALLNAVATIRSWEIVIWAVRWGASMYNYSEQFTLYD